MAPAGKPALCRAREAGWRRDAGQGRRADPPSGRRKQEAGQYRVRIDCRNYRSPDSGWRRNDDSGRRAMVGRKLTTLPGRIPATRAVPGGGDIAASGGE